MAIICVYLLDDRIDPIAIGVECRQHRRLVAPSVWVEPEKRTRLDKDGHFHRTVMRPEANAPTPGIETAAKIGKIQSHFELRSSIAKKLVWTRLI